MFVSAFAPANLSCIFKPVIGNDPGHTGSVGLGFTINEGVIVEVSNSGKNEILFNNKPIIFPTVKSVVKKLAFDKKVTVEIKTSLSLGCGFGLSGGSAIATAYAINKLLNLNKSNLELAKIAHIAEVENKTGLGDVTNQYFGGCILKTKPSFMFEVEKVPLHGISVFCKVISPLKTKSVLSDENKSSTIQIGSVEALKNISVSSNLSQIIKASKQFAVDSGLLENRKVMQTISDIEKKGGHASMIMLGNSIFSDINFPGAIKYKISDRSAVIL